MCVCVCVCVCVCLHKIPTFPNYSRHILPEHCNPNYRNKSGMWVNNGTLLTIYMTAKVNNYLQLANGKEKKLLSCNENREQMT